MPSVLIDASVLAVPHKGCAKDDALHYVETLRCWDGLINEAWIFTYKSENSDKYLWDGEGLDFLTKLKQFFDARHDIETLDGNTAITLVSPLLGKTKSFEAEYKINDVVTDNLSTDPDFIGLTINDSLQEDLRRSVALAAVVRKYCTQPIGGHLLMMKDAPESIIQLQAEIVLQHYNKDIPALPIPPDVFEGDVRICENFQGLIECLDESKILIDAIDDAGIELAIRVAMFKYKIEHGEAPEWKATKAPAIGEKFYQQCKRVCKDKNRSKPILRSIVEIMEKINMQDTHALRTGEGGGDPQRKRGSDEALAWRRDIDKARCLHYWKRDDGTVELAWVTSEHDDFRCPE